MIVVEQICGEQVQIKVQTTTGTMRRGVSASRARYLRNILATNLR